MKKSLEHSALPTVEEIKLYQEGKLSPSRTHEIELLAEENPMLGDALEGYAALPLFAAVPSVTAAVGQQAAASSANGVIGGTKGIASFAKSASSLWQLNNWVIGFGIVGVSAAVITTIVMTDESETNTAMTNEVNKPIQTNEEKATLIEGDEQTASHATESHELKTKEASNSQIVVDNQLPISYTNSISVSETHPSSNIDHESTIESPLPFDIDPIMTVESNPSVVSDEAGLKLSNSSVVAVGITTIMKYKVADYTQLRKATWDKINIEDLSLSANYAAKANKEAEEQSNKIQIPYLQYIEQCITVYDNQEYRTAINGFLARPQSTASWHF